MVRNLIAIGLLLILQISFAQTDSISSDRDSLEIEVKNKIWSNLKYDATTIFGATLNGFSQPAR